MGRNNGNENPFLIHNSVHAENKHGSTKMDALMRTTFVYKKKL